MFSSVLSHIRNQLMTFNRSIKKNMLPFKFVLSHLFISQMTLNDHEGHHAETSTIGLYICSTSKLNKRKI